MTRAETVTLAALLLAAVATVAGLVSACVPLMLGGGSVMLGASLAFGWLRSGQ